MFFLLLLFNFYFYIAANQSTDDSNYKSELIFRRNNNSGLRREFRQMNFTYYSWIYNSYIAQDYVEIIHYPHLKFGFKLLILILTNTDMVWFRNELRPIYRRLEKLNITYIFVCQESTKTNIDEEADIYGDILQFKCRNNHGNNGKVVLESLKFLSNHLYIADYILKTDMDCTINVCKLVEDIRSLNEFQSIFGSECVNYPEKFRHKHRDYELYWSYGAGFTLLMNDIPRIVNLAYKLKEVIFADDRYIPMLTYLLGIKCKKIENFVYIHNGQDQYTDRLKQRTIIHNDGSFNRTIHIWNYSLIHQNCLNE